MANEDYARLRQEMVKNQIEARGIRDARVLDAMRVIPREEFVPEDLRGDAYRDGAMGIGSGQTISQPYIVALMTQALEPEPTDRILEVGTGSGYQAAILCRLCQWVYTIERLPELSKEAEIKLRQAGYENFTPIVGDGTLGCERFAPYDGIIVTAAAPDVPDSLSEQLAEGGRLVLPVGSRQHQVLYQYRKVGDKIKEKRLCDCVFVPLLGKQGW